MLEAVDILSVHILAPKWQEYLQQCACIYTNMYIYTHENAFLLCIIVVCRLRRSRFTESALRYRCEYALESVF